MSNNRIGIASGAGKILLMISIFFSTRDLNCFSLCGSSARWRRDKYQQIIVFLCASVDLTPLQGLARRWCISSREMRLNLSEKIAPLRIPERGGSLGEFRVGLARAETLTHLTPAFSFSSIPLFCYTFLTFIIFFCPYVSRSQKTLIDCRQLLDT
jgi:hypothetical protein